ncbi:MULTISPECIES: metal ABC transporter ATP-binding protein [Bacillus cereus group]|uniref:Manganese transporter n=1 Tax=Bacillus wiedmannii TaxID=1890302 RepID=A0A2B5NKC0_9BACI|nr:MULTISPECIES: metal ABC transporter ATP-binding protein [Bacillus cereus group]KMP77738.1 manganese transporter [Bacillus cereus]MBG9855238.1 manganese transporter [Bacillus wiedmannii]MBG9856452.1 manganese transporter [Bacillus wiedmannii]MBJ8083505.1 metal ABC transporter ATP-binding protein [Bacillus cereus group sp. N14]MCU5578058.1 metal ABC transporter ATP-binding protein [Bacillus wiedmannii]
MGEAIIVKDLFVSYQGNQVVQNVSFNIGKGNLVGIIGPNGAGKSTLMKAVLDLIPSDKGYVQILGEDIRSARKHVAYVPQRSDIDWDFPITVLDVVLIGTYPSLGMMKRPRKEHRDWAFECLKKVGMEEFKDRQIGELSGGQQQRVFLARALAQKAEIFFLDEPFVGIDVTSEETIIKILRELRKEGKTIVVVHHDLSKAESYFDKLLLLNKSLIHYGEVRQVLEPTVMSKAYVNHGILFNNAAEVHSS